MPLTLQDQVGLNPDLKAFKPSEQQRVKNASNPLAWILLTYNKLKEKKLTKNMHLYSNKVISELQVSIYISQKQTNENVSRLNLKKKQKTVDSLRCYST